MSKRRFCVDEPVLSDKSISYELYGKLQLESEFKGKGESRMIKMTAAEKKDYMDKCGFSENTWKRKVASLEKKGLIKRVKLNEYELPEYGRTYFLIPEKTIAHLLTTATAEVIKVYAYLGSKNNRVSGGTLFTKTELAAILGWSATNRGTTNKKIDSILNCLIDARLVEIERINIDGTLSGSRFLLKKFNLDYQGNSVLSCKKDQK